jgi:GTP pyrophosphokinase
MMVKLARCCTPVPGDDIRGFVTRGRGVSVHRRDCPNIGDLDREPERFVPVEWAPETTASFLATIQVEALDRKQLLRDITAVLGELHINITSAQVTTRRDRVAVLRVSFELGDPVHLKEAIRAVGRIDGVYDVYRVIPQVAGSAGPTEVLR